MYVAKVLLGAAAGGVAGYLWHRLVGCPSNMCQIVRNPCLSTIWGAMLGYIFTRG